ncbi:profilin [Histomonas meleagridis]|uniref:profilin n=1 Tax=Histomonas meleagridis TaxID=135588 RepID=UPI0035597610|nr:profilin [Histomonas meleagridis]KAH0799915.1 profilin [Histomonas meleagridis]
MSWAQFIDLLGTNVTSASIFRFDGQVLASTEGFSLSEDELMQIFNIYDKGSAFLSAHMKFQGNEYSILKADSENLQMRFHSYGLMMSRCKTCFVFAYHNDRIQPQNCYKAVVEVADILRSYGY